MQFKLLHAFAALTLVGLLAGCHSKIDLTDINKQAEVDLGVALPIGSIHATIGDFLGTGRVSKIYMDSTGVFHFIDTVNLPTKDFHKIDLTKYILQNSKPLKFNIKDKVGKSVIHGDGSTETMLDYKFSLSTEAFCENLADERVDSIQVSEASFVSIIDVEDFGLKWSEIKKVQLILGDQIRIADNVIDIPIDDYGYDEKIPITIKNFSVDLMDHDNGGTIDKVYFKIKFYVCPKDGHDVAISEDSQFSYDLRVNVVDYDAIWGFFQAGNEMRDAQVLYMDSLWEDWKNVKKLKVRFMEPTIEAFVTHQIAAPVVLYIDYITAIDSAGNATHATWDNDIKTHFPLQEVINPYSRNLSDSITNRHKFTYEPDKGNIDALFNVRPDRFGYSFYAWVDTKPRQDDWKNWDVKWQNRITRDASVHGYAVADVPFKVNTGSELEYTTTLQDIDISNISLDSLMASVEMLDSLKASNIKLILDIENGLPFAIEGTFTFCNKDSVDMHMHLFEDNEKNHLLFPAPEMVIPAGEVYGYVSKPSSTRVIINIDQNDFDRLSEVGYIRMDAAMYGNPAPCKVSAGNDLRIRLGLAAHVDAVLDFNRNNNENNDNQ